MTSHFLIISIVTKCHSMTFFRYVMTFFGCVFWTLLHIDDPFVASHSFPIFFVCFVCFLFIFLSVIAKSSYSRCLYQKHNYHNLSFDRLLVFWSGVNKHENFCAKNIHEYWMDALYRNWWHQDKSNYRCINIIAWSLMML